MFSNSQSGFVIASYKTADKHLVPQDAVSKYQPNDGLTAFSAIGSYLPTSSGVEMEITGGWEKGKYGLQLKAVSCNVLRPKAEEGIVSYLGSGLIKGIGPATAQAIVDKFGVSTLDIIDDSPRRLLEVRGISESKYQTIVETYNNSMGLRDVMTGLADYGVTPKKGEKILAAFGVNATEAVKENPYILCKIQGFGFITVDNMAKAKGFAPDNPMRIKEGVIYTLHEAQRRGHLFLLSDELASEASKLLMLNGTTKKSKSKDSKATESTSNNSSSNGVCLIKRTILELVLETRLQENNGRIYLPHNYLAEHETAKLVRAMIDHAPIVKGGKEAINLVLKVIQNTESLHETTLAAKQRDAVLSAVTNNFTIITGGPGTGKTTVVKALVAVYKKLYALISSKQSKSPNIAFAAPTGRASRRLSESVGYEATTLHSVLGIGIDNDGNGIAKGKKVIEADLLIVDECSMVDMQLAFQLFKALRPTTRLVMVGDYNQLPSVGAGNVFRELILCGEIPVTKLDVVHRQAQTSRINLNAHLILEGETSLLYGASDFDFVPVETAVEAATMAKTLFYQHIKQVNHLTGKPYGANNVQILSPMRSKGRCSVYELNTEIQEAINPKSDDCKEVVVGSRPFRLYDKVMETKNRDAVSNGDVGRIRKIERNGDDYTVSIDFGGEKHVPYTLDEMVSIDLAYATTIHKSMGSEYPIVIIPILSEAYILLQRNLIYTAITRAKAKVILVGQMKYLFAAIHKSDTAARNTVLGELVSKQATGFMCAVGM